jgi:hypothetical protein
VRRGLTPDYRAATLRDHNANANRQLFWTAEQSTWDQPATTQIRLICTAAVTITLLPGPIRVASPRRLAWRISGQQV